MVSINIQEPVTRQKPANLTVHVPASFWAHLEAKDGEEVIVQCAIGRHGPLVYIVNPQQQKSWKKRKKEAEKREAEE